MGRTWSQERRVWQYETRREDSSSVWAKGSLISIVPFATPSVDLVWLLSRRVNDTGGPGTLPSDALQSKTGRC